MWMTAKIFPFPTNPLAKKIIKSTRRYRPFQIYSGDQKLKTA